MPRNWYLVATPSPSPGWWNMALDLALLEEAERSGTGFVRLYRWEPFCLSFGRHEPALRRYDRAAVADRGLDVVRRPTGGRAVWHARELTYAVAAPLAWFGSLQQTYCALHTVLAAALRALGLPAELAPARPAAELGAGACFASAAGGEVLLGARKVVGSAQLRYSDAFLQHGSVLLAGSQDEVAAVTLGPAPRGREGSVAEAAGHEVPFAEAADAVTAAFRSLPGSWHPGPEPAVLEAMVARHAAHFRDPAWTWRR